MVSVLKSVDIDWHGFPRIPLESWTAALTAVCVLAIGAAVARTALRLYHFRRLSIDDIALAVSVCSLIASYGLCVYMRDYMYSQVLLALGFLPIPEDVLTRLVRYLKLMAALNVLQWTSIFTVKFSYLLFFRKLIDRVRWMAILWWCIFVFVVSSGLVCMFLPLTVCTHLDEDTILERCTFDSLFVRQNNGLIISTTLDISTDIAVITLPMILISKVRFNLVRKLAIGSILCLSVAMILIASIRIAFAYVPGRITPDRITDSVWLSFWQTTEAAVAILMVSITGFKSIFGQKAQADSRRKLSSAYSRRTGTIGTGSNSRVTQHVRKDSDVSLVARNPNTSPQSSPVSALPPVAPQWPSKNTIVKNTTVTVRSEANYRPALAPPSNSGMTSQQQTWYREDNMI